MALLEELDEMRASFSGPTGSRANVEESRNYYMKLMAQQPTYEEELREQMRKRDQRTADIRREERRTREELTGVRPQAYKKYGAEEPRGMPKMRPEDLTAMVAAEEAQKQRTIDRLRAERERRAGSREEAIQRALGAYETRTKMAGELARQAAEDYRTALSARRTRRKKGPSLSEALKLQERQMEARNLTNLIASEVGEAFRTTTKGGKYQPQGVISDTEWGIPVGEETPEEAQRIAGVILRRMAREGDYSPYAVRYATETIRDPSFLEREQIARALEQPEFSPYGDVSTNWVNKLIGGAWKAITNW